MAHRLLKDMIPEIIQIGKPPMSPEDISRVTDRNANAVRKLLKQLHENGDVHIASWGRAIRGPFIAQYTWGKGIDAPKIEKLTNREICSRYRNTEKGKKVHTKGSRAWRRKNNATGLKSIQRNQAKALKKYQSGGVAAIDPLLAAIMGMK